ncbi:hypothetical protein IFM89_024605 [Coptis chinensis]|uniref:F-box associated beta-propeller type 1 domain-containing protein n=1 Tax=Coptis chinensis TaxID=261450 RepID=A0A835M1I7_9MAGN|nr:hypothetical protein IFM89_024605 [Coptis chinensis]
MFLNGAIHWIAKSKNKYRETLISFSIKEKVFREFSSPMDEYDFMTVGVLGGELCVLCKTYGIDLDIWVMKNYGLSDSWVKPFAMERTIKMSVSDSCSSHLLYNKRNPRPLCFAKSGEVLLRDGNVTFCRGCQRSGTAMRRCLGILKPKFVNVTRESWEELDSKEIAKGAVSLRWLLWPNIDGNSWLSLVADSPRIVLNPNPSPFSFRGVQVQIPTEAIADIALDDPFVKDIDPKTWAVSGFVPRVVPLPVSSPTELPKAERFRRLAFVERDERLQKKSKKM